MRVLSLFSGGGLGDYGLELAGMEIVGQVEIDDYCQKILKLRWPDVPKWKDIKEVHSNSKCKQDNPIGRNREQRRDPLERNEQTTQQENRQTNSNCAYGLCGASCEYCLPTSIELVAGGFPCQPFSVAGKRKGTGDERDLWKEMFRVIREVKPRWVLAENVPGLLSISDGRKFGEVVRDLASVGYCVEWDCIPACAVGAPHRRDRVWILAYRNKRSRSSKLGEQQETWSSVFNPGGKGNVADADNLDSESSVKDVGTQGQDGREVLSRPRANVADPGQFTEGDASGGFGGKSKHSKAQKFRAEKGDRFTDGGKNVADSNKHGRDQAGQDIATTGRDGVIGKNWWSVEPDVGRVAYGVSRRMERLKLLGNGQVCQATEWLGAKILKFEESEKAKK